MRWTVHLEGAPKRVNHAAVAVDNCIYSFGGYCSSEGFDTTGYIDVWMLNTDSLKWSPVMYRTTGKAVPFRRYGHTVVAFGRKIYLWGGRNDFVSSKVLHCFDLDTYTWSLPPTFGQTPQAGDGHSACVIEDFMYIFGGFDDQTEKFRQCVHRLNLHSFEWELIQTYGTPPMGRDFHTASAIGNRMYVFAGRGSHSDDHAAPSRSDVYCNKIMYLDTTCMKWVMPETHGEIPCGRRSHSAVVYNDELYVIGGYNGVTLDHLNDIYRFNPESNTWSFVCCRGQAPCPRRRHCSCLVGDRLYLFGGSSPYDDSKNVSNTDEEYQKLVDHGDLHVLDFFPTLKTLCQLKIIEWKLNTFLLPKSLIQEIDIMTNRVPRSEPFPRKDYGVFTFSA